MPGTRLRNLHTAGRGERKMMNVHKISFIEKAEAEINDEILERIWDYLSSLYKNGQILKNYELIHNAEELFAYVTLPDDDALKEDHNNLYVSKYRDQVLGHFLIESEAIGRNVNQDASCECPDPSWYMLYTDYSLLESPVVCGDCGKAYPLYKLPHIRHHEHFDVLSWQKAYTSIDRLFLECLSDRFTLRQMRDPDSQLAQIGREICKDFEEITGKPFYYYLFEYRKTRKTCPVCHSDWKLEGIKSFIDFKCEKCRLVADRV